MTATKVTVFEVTPQGPFELAAAKWFLEGFTPADQPATDREDLVVAMLGDDWQPLLARVTQTPTGVLVEVEGDSDPRLARAQIERMLSLDVDGSTFPAVGERDPIVGELQQRYHGLRPVMFARPTSPHVGRS